MRIYLLSIILVPVGVEVVLLYNLMPGLDIIVDQVIHVIHPIDSQHMGRVAQEVRER